jgi:hypothetical protein
MSKVHYYGIDIPCKSIVGYLAVYVGYIPSCVDVVEFDDASIIHNHIFNQKKTSQEIRDEYSSVDEWCKKEDIVNCLLMCVHMHPNCRIQFRLDYSPERGILGYRISGTGQYRSILNDKALESCKELIISTLREYRIPTNSFGIYDR